MMSEIAQRIGEHRRKYLEHLMNDPSGFLAKDHTAGADEPNQIQEAGTHDERYKQPEE